MKRSSFALIPTVFLSGCMYSRVEVPTPARAVADPPSRVARLSYISGPVSFKAAGTDAWVAALTNRPLTAGDELWTDRDAPASYSTTTQIRLRRLDEEDEFELATPQAAVTLLRTGDYRLTVNPGVDATDLTVRAGQAEFTSPAQAFSVRTNQQARMIGNDTLRYEVLQAPPLDGLDSFCQNRDRRSERAESLQYVSPYVIG
jgi:hypothetical protein